MNVPAHGTPRSSSILHAQADLAQPWARLAAAPDGGTRLRLGGRLVPGWAGTLAFGLSRLHVTILRGCACCMSRGKWTAFFDIQALTGAPALEAIDFPALALGREERVAPAAIRLERYVLGPIVGGALQLAIYGQDCVALLGDLLDRLAGLSLFPEEMHVEARAGQAEGRFRFNVRGTPHRLHVHPERRQFPGQGLADSSQSHDESGAASQHSAQRSPPYTLLESAETFVDASGNCKHQEKSMFGRGIGIGGSVSGDVANHYAVRGCSGDIDAFEPHSPLMDQFR